MAYVATFDRANWFAIEDRRSSSDAIDDTVADEDILRAEHLAEIANEFTIVRVRKVYTRNGERLEIVAPKLGYRIRLDPLELESLTWQPPETFSEFLATPFGPGRD